MPKHNIILKPFTPQDLEMIWQIGFTQDRPEWKKWDGPYFEDYQAFDDFEDFKLSGYYNFFSHPRNRGIFLNDQPIGFLSRNWEDEKTRWLEVGIVIFDPAYWSGGYGSQALKEWISTVFEEVPEIQHIGLTTWSGNHRMMRCAEKIGLIKEAQIRKVRYWQDTYYDSVKYGILRDEWQS